jgi:UPF0716 protein FxsA
MFLLLLLLSIILPIAEVVVLARVIARIGIWDTLFLLIFAGVFGAYLAKLQGRAALLKIQEALAKGKPPTAAMLDSLLVFLGGVLFIIPGFVSDLLGLFLLFPVTRWFFRWWVLLAIASNFRARAERGPYQGSKRPRMEDQDRGDVQDAEIVE